MTQRILTQVLTLTKTSAIFSERVWSFYLKLTVMLLDEKKMG